MRGMALLAFLITSWLTVAAFGMHQKHPDQIGLAPAVVLGAVALASIAVAMFGKSSVSAGQRNRDHNGLRNVCAACGQSGGRRNPLALRDGYRVCASHLTDPSSGLYRGQR